ncbi:MAG: tol-pal system protein YbgF [Bdellovibrionales bacterium]
MSGIRLLFLAVALAAVLFITGSASAQQGSGIGPNFEMRLSAVEDQMRAMNGRIEQMEFAVRRIDQAMQRLQADIDVRFQRMESAAPPQSPVTVSPPPPQAAPAQPAANNFVSAPTAAAASSGEPVSLPTASGTLGAIKMQDGKVTGAINHPQAPPLPDAPPDYGLTPQEQYDRAFDLLRQANYDEAGTAFEAFIAKNPQDKLIDNAKYWHGETLYVQGKFDAAAVAFADAYQQNPQGGKAPDSLLKLAMSLQNIGKTGDACTTLESLKNKYPRASLNVRQRAEQERVKLKCGGAPPAARTKAQ